MATRSKETTLTFSKAFALSDVDRPLLAGTYRVVVDEEDITGLSFLAFRRVATMLQVPALSAPGRPMRQAALLRCFSSTPTNLLRPSKPIALRHEPRLH